MFRLLCLSWGGVDRESGVGKGVIIFAKVARIQTCLSKDKHWPQICLLAGWVRRARKLHWEHFLFCKAMSIQLQLLITYSIQDKETSMSRKTPKVDCTFISIRGFLGGTSQHNTNPPTLQFFLCKLPNTPPHFLFSCRLIKSQHNSIAF